MASPVRRQRVTTAAAQPVAAVPTLTVVGVRRRFAGFAVVMAVLVGAVMIGSLVFHTMIAERQLHIDGLERSVRQAQSDFDVLRAERAELRSPTRLADEASLLGMAPGEESRFVTIDPMTYAVVIAKTGEIPVAEMIGAGANTRLEPLDQFRLVKSVSAEAP